MNNTIADRLPEEQKRVRGLIQIYHDVAGPAGAFAIALMERELEVAEKAAASGDVVAMIRSVQSLSQFSE